MEYLKRISFNETPEMSLDCLCRLQASHQLTVPFENLDVFMGKHITLKIDSLYKKIVLERRGGWCCELNGLFAWLLQKIGFDVTLISCSHYNAEIDTFDDIFDHLALLVNLQNVQYLVDVGYGHINQHLEPIEVSENNVIHSQVSCDCDICQRFLKTFKSNRKSYKMS